MPTAVQLGLSSYPSQAYGATGENLGQFPTIPADPDYSQETHPDYPQGIWNQLRDNHYFQQNIPSQYDLDRARHEQMVAASGLPQMQPFSTDTPEARATVAQGLESEPGRVQALQALEKTQTDEENYNALQHLGIAYGLPPLTSMPGASTSRQILDRIAPVLTGVGVPPEVILPIEDSLLKVNRALSGKGMFPFSKSTPDVGNISDDIRDLVQNKMFADAREGGIPYEEAYALPNLPRDRRDFEDFTNELLREGRDLTREDIDWLSKNPPGTPTSDTRMPELDFSRMLASSDPIGAVSTDRTVEALENLRLQDWNLRDRMSQMYERAFIDPDEYGWTRPTIEQRQEAIRGVQGAPKGFWGALQDRIANLIPGAEASVARDVEFEREQREPTWFPPTTSSGIGGMVEEPATSPFIDDAGFTPSLDARTLGGPVVGDEEEEVSEERVVEIKKKPKEKRTSVEEQVVVASEVKKALDNASKGKKVKNELKAIVELAKVDPTIVKRYTTPGSQALQDITAQVDSFSFMPTIQKKKKQPVVDPWAFEDRRGGRR